MLNLKPAKIEPNAAQMMHRVKFASDVSVINDAHVEKVPQRTRRPPSAFKALPEDAEVTNITIEPPYDTARALPRRR